MKQIVPYESYVVPYGSYVVPYVSYVAYSVKNINILFTWMSSFEIFRSVCAAAASDDGKIRCRPPSPSPNTFFTEYKSTSQDFGSSRT